jgi:K(+)-stimulated pyrophosphate-energized sodium pump
MESTMIPVITVGLGLLLSYMAAGGLHSPILGLYGISLAAVGMLSTLGITLATDAYGPIADNAGGNAEMAGLPPEVRERTDELDAVGNTTAAIGKGFAIGSAALTALALIAAYIDQIRFSMHHLLGQDTIEVGGQTVSTIAATVGQLSTYFDLTLLNPALITGLFVGAMTVFYFAALTMSAVGRAAGAMVDEVRRQFKEIPGIMEGTGKPDYARCVDISTAGAQREMVLPSLLAIIIPVLMGVLFGAAGVIGLLGGALSTGFVMAVMMANAGGAWDNSKKTVEKMKGSEGKGSELHKAVVVGDTVGDPFKDTSGPSLNILIKLMSMVSVIFAALTASVGTTGLFGSLFSMLF